MKVGIDIRGLMEGKTTGVGEYSIGVIKFLLENNPHINFVLFTNSYKKPYYDFSWLSKYENAEIKQYHFPNKLLNLFLWLLRWPKVDKLIGSEDVFFMPNCCFIGLGKKSYKILTIHDLSFERLAKTYSLKRRLWHFMVNPRKFCTECDKVLAVSECTKKDIQKLYGIDKKKIKISHPHFSYENFSAEIPLEARNEILEKYRIKNDYILYLGTLEPRKNINSIIEAFELLKKDNNYKSLKLVISGGKGWLYKKIFKKAQESLFGNDIIFTGFVEEQDKPALYQGASVFIYPSFYEGFGLPPLEAMAAGKPVIASCCTSVPEILKDSAILIDPYRPAEISQVINELFSSETLYQHYCQKGAERAKEVSKINRTFSLMD